MKRLANLRTTLQLGDRSLDEALPELLARAGLTRLERITLARYLAGHKVAEIATALSTTPYCVKASVRRAVAKLRTQTQRRKPGKYEYQAQLRAAWAAVSADPSITARTLAARLGIDPQAAHHRLQALVERGYVERVPGRYAWRVPIPYQNLV